MQTEGVESTRAEGPFLIQVDLMKIEIIRVSPG